MELQELQRHWHQFGQSDPFWAIMSDSTRKNGGWARSDFFETGRTTINDLFRYLDRRGITFQRQRALDFGCGVGRLTQALCPHFQQCYGVDIAPSMIQLARKFNRYFWKCRYFLNTTHQLGIFPKNHFDFICAWLVLQHMQPDYIKSYLEEFIRVLRPGGVAIFQLPSHLAQLEAMPESAYQAELQLLDPLPSILEDTTHLRVLVRNRSSHTWERQNALFLGNHWLNLEGESVVYDDGRAGIQQTLKPGEAIELRLTVHRPQDASAYLLELDMVHEQICWFKQKGSPTLTQSVKFQERPTITPGQSEGSLDLDSTEQVQTGFQRFLDGIKVRLPFLPVADRSSQSKFVPKMEMYFIPKDELIDWIQLKGGTVLDIFQDETAGSEFISYNYCITKQ